MSKNLLLSEEGYPGKTKVMSVYEHILDKQVWGTAMLLGQKRKGDSITTNYDWVLLIAIIKAVLYTLLL